MIYIRYLFFCFITVAFCAMPSQAMHRSKELLIKFQPAEQRSATQFNGALEHFKAAVIKTYQIVPGLLLIKWDSHYSETEVQSELSQIEGVKYVQLNYLRKPSFFEPANLKPPTPITRPALPAFVAPPSQWIKDPKETSNFGVAQNHSNQVWRKYGVLGDPSVIIAVLDTGIDYTHRDLVANLWRNPGESGLSDKGVPKETNQIDDDGNGYIDDVVGYDFHNKASLPYDDHSHGTHVAGTAAATGGNGYGISGHCPRCSIMGLKFIGANGSGADADAIEGLEYAIKMGATVINSSWGGSDVSAALYEAFEATSKAGIFNAVAAGNEGKDLEMTDQFPAEYNLPGQATVAAMTLADPKITPWSNYSRKLVHLPTAGFQVTSTVPGNRFADYSGTSMASPGIAGCAGLIKSYRPTLSPEEIKSLFDRFSLGDLNSGAKTLFGGRPNMLKIFEYLQTH